MFDPDNILSLPRYSYNQSSESELTPTTAYLSGPPEIRKSSAIGQNPTLNPAIDSFNSINFPRRKGFTQGLSRTYPTTSNPCLDFFFNVVPSTPRHSLIGHLESAWASDALTTLKLICNLRGVRGTGKGNKEGYYEAVIWLHNFHPKTLAANVEAMVDFGYFKDLPEILDRLVQTPEFTEVRVKRPMLPSTSGRGHVDCTSRGRRGGGRGRRGGGRGGRGGLSLVILRRRVRRGGGRLYNKSVYGVQDRNEVKRPFVLDSNAMNGSNIANRWKSREARIFAEKKKIEIRKKEAKQLREENKVIRSNKAVTRYMRDPDYRVLYETISDIFANCLKKDLQLLESGKLKSISLAAKWCPSLDSSFDKSTLLCESIARKIFPKEFYPEYEGLEEAHYAYRVRDRLRKQVLVPLRKALQLPEVYLGASEWDSLAYNRVASVAMTKYKEKFLKRDRLRFEEYLEKVKSGKATIAAGALLPHKIIASLNDGDLGEVAELQWKKIVDDLSSKGKLKNCIAVCDVTMKDIYLDVCLALGVLVSELSEEPWKGNLITFSTNPKLQKAKGDDLRSKVNFVTNMEVESKADFQKVFDVILKVALTENLTADEMIKKVFVFSDMEFDEASENMWETDYQAITRKYMEKGYGSCVPEIVFWKLKDSKAIPVPQGKPGVALVSGYSKNMMSLFLEDKGSMTTPESVMEVAISGDEYSKLVVVD